MGNRTGQLFKKRDIDDNSLEALCTSQLKSSILTAKDTVIIGDLTIFSRKILGNGFFGTVFEGQWHKKPCAVKVLSPLGQELLTGLPITQQDNVQEEALLKFKKECDFMKSYEHPNIVTYYNTVFYPDCNLPVLVMELMQTSLRRYIHEGAVMSVKIQVSLSYDIASALEFLHNKGLVHRDLCGDNILLNYNQDIPVAKVSDFGISRIIVKPDQLSHSLTALGHRPGYLPPEAFSIDPTDYNSSLDIFMFGVVMTQIASKVPTVDSYHQRQKLVSQLDDQHPLKPFIHQCLSEKREERPSASTLLSLLSRALHLREECPSFDIANSARKALCKPRSWENELDNSNVIAESHECRGATPSMGLHGRNTNSSSCGSLIERNVDEQERTHMWPSQLHWPPIEDVFYKQNPWEQQLEAATVLNDEENFANQKSLSRSSISDYKILATSHVPHIVGEHQEHSHTDQWTASISEDRALREEFPDVDGYLFEAWLNKSKNGLGLSIKNGLLGLSIMASTTNRSLSGIVITNIQKGGAAEENGKIKRGDMVLKVNDTCVIGMSQTQVHELLANASPKVRLVLLRQYATTGEGGGDRVGGAKPELHTTTDSFISLEGLPQAQVVTLYCEDKKKGFGFHIENHEELDSGVYTMIVSNITRGGAAEASGQLQVGDWILSVDGTSTLGCAVEKASDLIQQGVSRGQVNLLIASREYLSPLSPQFRNGHMGLAGVWGVPPNHDSIRK